MHLRIVMLGPPAAGKGTQAELLRERFGFQAPSVGAMLRAQLAARTPLGIEAARYFERGFLAPDEISIEVVREWLEANADSSWAIDGFPRTTAQAEALEGMLATRGAAVDFALLLEASETTIRDRILHRTVCLGCGRTWRLGMHVEPAAPCPRCGHALSRRSDDLPETLAGRLAEYRAKTAPVIDYYRERGILRAIDGERPVEEVFTVISSTLALALA